MIICKNYNLRNKRAAALFFHTKNKEGYMNDVIRIGKVSSVDYEKGMVSVYYEDRTAMVTSIMPVLSNGRYKMPKIGESILVAHLSNGTNAAVVLGTVFNDANVPKSSGQNVYYEELSDNTMISSDGIDITLKAAAGSINVSTLLNLIKRVEALERR
jgi:phage-related baseplate assembly protein